MERYIGLDVHSTTSTCVVLSPTGRVSRRSVVQTTVPALRELVRGVRKPSVLVMEEGNQSEWLFEMLSPHVSETLVVQPESRRGRKSDVLDAEWLARVARRGEPGRLVYKSPNRLTALRHATKLYRTTQRDLTRCRARLKLLVQSRGVHPTSAQLLDSTERELWIQKLPVALRARASVLGSMTDAMQECHDDARQILLRESRNVPAIKWVESVPGFGPIRAAQTVSTIVSPHRFRTKRQLWSYSRLAVITHSSNDWVSDGRGGFERRRRNQLVLGLNRNGSGVLKSCFIGAAQQIISRMPKHPLRAAHDKRIEAGMKPSNARLTLARKLAAIVLAVWKKEENYDRTKS